ncbi:hypothetical protein SAMN04488115_109123 [Bosea lathyri]|uniref:Uncharacterized protein n=1 Tax=Bosea lathyri TaxID=1036778 RepID=A0A1H6C861_9HYPH|nr:hypothetical protein SAMN04488115_109123 [Bosea lathyri]
MCARRVLRSGPVAEIARSPLPKRQDDASPIDRDTRLAQYRAEGWNRFDEKAEPYKSTVI